MASPEEDLAKELQQLAKRNPLGKKGVERAMQIMAELVLSGSLSVPCKLCGKLEPFEFAPEHVDRLLKGDPVTVISPPYETCGSSGARHEYDPPTLARLIEAKLVGRYGR